MRNYKLIHSKRYWKKGAQPPKSLIILRRGLRPPATPLLQHALKNTLLTKKKELVLQAHMVTMLVAKSINDGITASSKVTFDNYYHLWRS